MTITLYYITIIISIELRYGELKEELSVSATKKDELYNQLLVFDQDINNLTQQIQMKKSQIEASVAAAQTGPDNTIDLDLLNPDEKNRRTLAISRLSKELQNKETEKSIVLEKYNKFIAEMDIYSQHMSDSLITIDKIARQIKNRSTDRLQQSYEFLERELNLYTELSQSLTKAFYTIKNKLIRTEVYLYICHAAKQDIDRYTNINVMMELTGK